jgi:hypothetical protein
MSPPRVFFPLASGDKPQQLFAALQNDSLEAFFHSL